MAMNRRLGIRAGVFAAAILASGLALQTQAANWSGLGAAWPSAPDVSRSVAFHAYKWQARGVAYIQINGADGAPLAAVAAAGGQVMILPIGRQDAVQIVPAGAARNGSMVFDDGAVSVTEADGIFHVQMVPADQCSDPIECGKGIVSSQSPMPQARVQAAEEPCTDPIECGKQIQ